MSKHCFNSTAFREGVATDEVGTSRIILSPRRRVVWRRKLTRWLWSVVDDYGTVYGKGECVMKKLGKLEYKPLLNRKTT